LARNGLFSSSFTYGEGATRCVFPSVAGAFAGDGNGSGLVIGEAGGEVFSFVTGHANGALFPEAVRSGAESFVGVGLATDESLKEETGKRTTWECGIAFRPAISLPTYTPETNIRKDVSKTLPNSKPPSTILKRNPKRRSVIIVPLPHPLPPQTQKGRLIFQRSSFI
jgi:hypothetical protein